MTLGTFLTAGSAPSGTDQARVRSRDLTANGFAPPAAESKPPKLDGCLSTAAEQLSSDQHHSDRLTSRDTTNGHVANCLAPRRRIGGAAKGIRGASPWSS